MSFELKIKTKINLKTIDTKPLTNDISKDMRKVILNRFRTSTSPNGSKWAGVSSRVGKPLWITGSLARSFKRKSSHKKASVYTNDIRSKIHQYGGIIRAKNKPYLTFKIGDKWIKVKQVKIKARPFVGFNKSLEKKYKEMVEDYYKKQLFLKLIGGVK